MEAMAEAIIFLLEIASARKIEISFIRSYSSSKSGSAINFCSASGSVELLKDVMLSFSGLGASYDIQRFLRSCCNL